MSAQAGNQTKLATDRTVPAPPRHTRRFLVGLGLLTLLAFLVRLTVCAQLSGNPAVLSPHSATDMATYKQLAIDSLNGKWPEFFYYQPFYYAAFLPLIYLVCGTGAWGPLLAQSLLGAATVWFTGLTAARLFGRRAGWLAAALLALARFHIFHTPYLLFEVLQGFWLALLVWMCVEAWHRNRPRWWLGTGLVLSAAILTRGNVVLLLPAVLALMLWRNRQPGRRGRAMLAAIGILVAVYLPQLPFSLHNYAHFHRWTGPSSAADAVLALGNTPEAPPGGLVYPPTFKAWTQAAGLPGAQRVSVAHNMLGWIRQEPGAWLELKFRMLLLYWNSSEIPNNMGIEKEAQASPVLRLPLLVDFGLLGSLALAGLVLATCHSRKSSLQLFLLYVVVVGCAATVLFYILGRFRVPNVPALCVLGAFAADTLWRRLQLWRANRPAAAKHVLYASLTVLAAALVVLQGFTFYCSYWAPIVTRSVRPYGVTVPEGATTTIYDHGSELLGGWAPLPVPDGGLRLLKTFRVRPALQDAQHRLVSISLPLLNLERTAVPARLQIGLDDGPEGAVAASLRPGLQWSDFTLGEIKPGSEWVRVSITVLPEPQRQVFLMVDTQRDYGRSHYAAAGAPQGLEIAAEACLELHLGPPPPPTK